MKLLDRKVFSESFTLTKNVTINGHIESPVSGRIEGTVTGDVKIGGKIIIAESAMVFGNISGKDVVVQGHVRGNVSASHSLTIAANAVVDGNVSSASMQIDTHAKVKGNIRKTQEDNETSIIINNTIAADSKPALSDAMVVRKEEKVVVIRKETKDSWW
jgi:cytoskeletal protein CcmA (bactofilin family)